MRVLLDSDILIEITRKRNPEILSQWQNMGVSGSVILYSPISTAEFWRGVSASEEEITGELFLSLDCAPADYRIGKLAGDLQRRYWKSHGLELADAIIAATAIQYDALLWTRNRKHYPMPELSFY